MKHLNYNESITYVGKALPFSEPKQNNNKCHMVLWLESGSASR